RLLSGKSNGHNGIRRPSESASAGATCCVEGSAENDAPGAGSGRHRVRISIRTITGTHSSLTSSRSRHVRGYRTIHTHAGAWRAQKPRETRTPLVTASAIHGVSENSESHLGSTLNPEGAVLTL